MGLPIRSFPTPSMFSCFLTVLSLYFLLKNSLHTIKFTHCEDSLFLLHLSTCAAITTMQFYKFLITSVWLCNQRCSVLFHPPSQQAPVYFVPLSFCLFWKLRRTWNHAICSLPRLASFPEHRVIEGHLCCCVYQRFVSFH